MSEEMSKEFKYGDEVFVAYNDEKDIYRDGYFYFCELGITGLIIKTKSNSILFIPNSKVLKIKKRHDNG